MAEYFAAADYCRNIFAFSCGSPPSSAVGRNGGSCRLGRYTPSFLRLSGVIEQGVEERSVLERHTSRLCGVRPRNGLIVVELPVDRIPGRKRIERFETYLRHERWLADVTVIRTTGMVEDRLKDLFEAGPVELSPSSAAEDS
jgi:hypothetical protein